MTVIETLEEIKNDFCLNYCKYTEECDKKLDDDEDMRPCPLDKL